MISRINSVAVALLLVVLTGLALLAQSALKPLRWGSISLTPGTET